MDPEFEDMNDIAVFTPGVWNGKPYSAAYLRWLYQNYLKYSTGPNAEFTPWLNINHEPSLSFGEVKRLRFAENGLRGQPTLYVDARVPKDVADMVRSGALRQPSIEFLSPTPDVKTGKIIGYYNKAGQLEPGPVFECLSFLGNELPGVKGLPPLSEATRNSFRDRSAARRTFGAIAMSRQDMLAALQKLGVDTSLITDVVPDVVLKSVLDAMQKGATAPVGQNGNGVGQMADCNDPTKKMNDGNIDPATLSGNAGIDAAKIMQDAIASTPPVNGQQQPTSVLMKFADSYSKALHGSMAAQMGGYVGTLQKQLAGLAANAEALNRQQSEKLREVRDGAISRFFDECGGTGTNQITPAMQASIRAMLEKCDHVARRKFSASATVGTELEERMAEIKATYPKQRSTGQQLSQRPVDQPGNSGSTAVRPEVVQRALQGMMTPKALTAYNAQQAKQTQNN